MKKEEKAEIKRVAGLLAVALHPGGNDREKEIALGKLRDLYARDGGIWILARGALWLACERAGIEYPR